MNIKKVFESTDGTKKFLIELDDKKLIESVFIPQKSKATLCISTQTGCAMGCKFCATSKIKNFRNLTTEEIINQVFLMEKETRIRPSSIVYMGIGEPMNNLGNVISSIKELNNPKIYNFSQKKITVSTCGVLKNIERLRNETNAMLAVSLHATNDKIRNELIPINKKYDIKKIIGLTNTFPRNKREKVMIEYLMIKNLNDKIEDLENLKKFFDKDKVIFNLIEYNQINDEFIPSNKKIINYFKEGLVKAGFKTFIRESRGKDINAACGQLVGK